MRELLVVLLISSVWISAVPSSRAAIGANGDLNCLVHPYTTIIVSAPVAGLLESVAVDRGDLVKEGQTLAMLDTSLERASGAVAHAQAELTNRHLADLELQRTAA